MKMQIPANIVIDEKLMAEAIKATGDNTVIELSDEEAAAFGKLTLPVTDRIVGELGGEAILAAMRGNQ